ncbi:NADH-quinone oxidoreductase subunit NuoH [Acetobacter sp. TBRC 12305]|uniref:NADH-quinone oxidoreductase subunit H n=1 Tax=Acetobacter garciniae TaxID=2817435 RepID=A0A939KQR9_9PROT|nr:NADH-quinone oxidoreductase subunit NuoH [Acetobacter garciniae]MBO1325737.1 NADH-quinone oxidoreductase subunit NuoH [Acetobacter garciniae]MBX0345637.1 NADH-quinone oxidoreductase subunit NuoH [Acetobacter garciniae]
MTRASLALVVLGPFALLGLATVLTWVERRLLGLWQDRHGPNRVGPGGLFQPVADGTKILFKQDWIPPFADRSVFILAPVIGMMTVLLSFGVIPLTDTLWIAGNLNVGLLFILGMMGLGVYAVVLAGWASNSKYALLGGMRAAAQMISYEVFMGLSLLGVVMLAGSFNLRTIVSAQAGLWFIVPQGLGFCVFLLAGLAETHRLPFDLPEGENELGAGFHTEYSGMKFGMFFIAEYAGIVLISALIATLYLGGWRGPWLAPALWFALKTGVVVVFFILLRAALPRLRYDQLMALGWKVLLPLSLLNVMATATVLMLRATP